MSDCRRIVERMTAYVDGTLAPAERAGIERHLQGCPPCRTVAKAEEGGRAVLRECATQLRSTAVPPGLRSRCEAIAREHSARGRGASGFLSRVIATPWRARFVPALLIALLLVFTASALFSLATRRSDALLAAQLTADHAKCFRLFASGDEPALDAHALEEAMAARYGWTVHIPPSSPDAGVKLIGARRCLYGEGTLPHVMYQVHGEDMSLYILDGVMRQAAEVRALGHRSHIWSNGRTTYVLVTPGEADDLSSAVRYLRQAVH